MTRPALQPPTPLRRLLPLLAWLCLVALTTLANDPGGGTNGVGPNVTVTDGGTYVTLANGTLTA